MQERDRGDFTLKGPDDFLRLDTLCAELLRAFCEWMQQPEAGGLSPKHAGTLAHAADRYLRDFVVDIKETGPADEDVTLVRQYLGNWYVVNTLAPSHAEIDRISQALSLLYAYLARENIVSEFTWRAVAQSLSDAEFFHRRLEQFWDLNPGAILGWREVDDYRRPPFA